MSKTEWKLRWKNWVAPTKLPNVWRRKEGGHLVRARVLDPTTGQLREIKKVLPNATELEALQWLEGQRSRVKDGLLSERVRRTLFSDYAVSLLEAKIARGEIRSRAGQDRWRFTLEHLIAGTTSSDGERFVPGLGELRVDEIRPAHIDRWKEGIAQLIAAGDYAPTTANGWLSILRVVLKAAARDHDLARVATDNTPDFDTSEHVTYSEESPNSLAPGDVGRFLEALREMYPQHYAMSFLGLSTGLRPCTLRPLRRRGPEADVLWEEGRLLVRRSQTRGERVMKTTKQRRRYSIALPSEVLEVLRWHVETQLATPEQQESDLLFPSITGGFRAPTVLNKPFQAVCDAIGLRYPFSQKGMRRTFNDLARAARVEDVVTRSISGHCTERMQHHYSTVRGGEQQAGLAQVVSLMQAREDRERRAAGPHDEACAGPGAGGAPTKKPVTA